MQARAQIFYAVLLSALTFAFAPSFSHAANATLVSGTTGTPLGGFGAGAVKFDANNGAFAAMTRPPADAYDFEAIPNARFVFVSSRRGIVKTVEPLKAVQNHGVPDDDAIYPLHSVNFGRIDDVQINLKGYSPLDNRNYDNMSLPYALYEVTLTNTSPTEVAASVAMQWDAAGEVFRAVPGKGITSETWTIFAKSDDAGAAVSMCSGADSGRSGNDRCGKSVSRSQGSVAVKILLAAHQTQTIRFVLAWYDGSDPAIAHYKSLYTSSTAIAERGLDQFDVLKANAEALVNRMRASNLPDWLKNQTLNTLVNMTTNSMYKTDGRVAFAEGQWTCFGTMDQMWHARQIVGQLTPFFAWEELRYWASTQMDNGQIHHDFNKMDVGEDKVLRSVLVDRNDTEHKDYRNIQKWVDLNSGFIISTFETYQATGDRKQFEFLWPHLKRAGQRILDQVTKLGSKKFPYTFDTSENSYDAGGDANPFNANISAVAYKIMVILATEKGEASEVEKYQRAYDAVVTSFRARYISGKGFVGAKHAESYFAGQWLALHMKLGEIWSDADTDIVLDKLNAYYQPYYNGLGNADGTYDEWTPYVLLHYGGLLLNSQRVGQWAVMQKDAYERQYRDRNKVFSHPLNILPVVKEPKAVAEDFHSKKQYISMPGLWRNYYDIVGYHRDARTQELWLTPILLPELNHQMVDAMYISPESFGSISAKESGSVFQNKNIIFKPERALRVSTLHLADNFGKEVAVNINGKAQPFTRSGTGYAKELLVEWNDTVGRDGVVISVSGTPGAPPPSVPLRVNGTSRSLNDKDARIGAYQTIEAEIASKVGRTSIRKDATGGAYVTSIHNFDYLQFSNVDFGAIGATTFLAKVASDVTGSSIEIVLDGVDGEVIGSAAVCRTNGDQDWANISAVIKKTVGVHNVILRFYGATEGNLMNIDSIAFGSSAPNVVKC